MIAHLEHAAHDQLGHLLTLTHALFELRRRRRFLTNHCRDGDDDDRSAEEQPPRQLLAAECHTEGDRDDGIHIGVGRHQPERGVREQPDVRRVPDDRAERDEIDPAEDRRGRRREVVHREERERQHHEPAREHLVAVAANGSSGMVTRAERTEPTDHMIAESTQSAIPQPFAPPDGWARTATPAKPTPTPASACHGSRSCPTRRRTTTHSGTDAMISDASPVGTLRSAKNNTAFAPGSRIPITMQEPTARREMRSVPPRSMTTSVINAPAAMKRVAAAKSGGIVSPVTAMPRYVDPQIT